MNKPAKRLAPNLVLALVCLPIFIGALDLTIVSAVLPPILGDLKVPLQKGLDDASWIVSGYLLAYSVSMAFMGKVSDLWGRRRVYIACLVTFIIGSIIVAMAPGWPGDLFAWIARRLGERRPDEAFMALYALIAGRIIQAFGAGALVPVSMALVGDLYPPQKRAGALGIIGGIDTAGWVLGHLYGGIMVQYFPWPVLFWLNLPIGGAALVLTAWALRGLPRLQTQGRFDWVGALLLSFCLLSFNLALNTSTDAAGGVSTGRLGFQQSAEEAASISLPWLLAAGVSLGLFAWVEHRVRSPLVNLVYFRKVSFSAAMLVNLLVGFCIMAGLVSVPLYMNTVPTLNAGLSLNKAALLAGYLLSAFTIPMAMAAPIGGWITNKIGAWIPSVAGMGLAVAGFWGLSGWSEMQSAPVIRALEEGLFSSGLDVSGPLMGTWKMAWGLILAGIGIGLTISPVATIIINQARPDERGSAAAIVILMRLVGMTASVSSLTHYGLQRSQVLLKQALEGIAVTDLQAQVGALTASTTRVIHEMALITAVVALAAIFVSLGLKEARSGEIAPERSQ